MRDAGFLASAQPAFHDGYGPLDLFQDGLLDATFGGPFRYAHRFLFELRAPFIVQGIEDLQVIGATHYLQAL